MSPSDPAIEPVQFRKRARTIWAMQWTGENLTAIQRWVGLAPETGAEGPRPAFDVFADRGPMLYVAANRQWSFIDTSEWIAKDSEGFYPIKNHVFIDTYDRADGVDSLGFMTVSTPVLNVDIRCLVPGPQLTEDQNLALDQLAHAAKVLGITLTAAHEPGVLAIWAAEHGHELENIPQSVLFPSPPPSKPVQTSSTGVADVIPLRPNQTGHDPVRFGKGLMRMREAAGLTRMQLKVLAELGNYSVVSEIEEGGRYYPSPSVMAKLASAFKMGPTEFEQACLHPGDPDA